MRVCTSLLLLRGGALVESLSTFSAVNARGGTPSITGVAPAAGSVAETNLSSGGNNLRMPVKRRWALVATNPIKDFVPLAGAEWIMTHRNREPGLVSQSLQGHFPQFRTAAITAAAIRQD
jgi:hypothetical protein